MLGFRKGVGGDRSILWREARTGEKDELETPTCCLRLIRHLCPFGIRGSGFGVRMSSLGFGIRVSRFRISGSGLVKFGDSGLDDRLLGIQVYSLGLGLKFRVQ